MVAGMKLADSLIKPPSGHFLLKVYRRGILIDVVDEKNLIVDGSKQVHAKLLGGAVTNQSVTQIAFGTNGTAPAGGNTAITGAFTKALDTVSYPATNQVQFGFSLLSGEDNPQAILEFGLLTAGGVLYARKVRSVALNKDSDLSLSGTWTISF
jgi:hypothetical protein